MQHEWGTMHMQSYKIFSPNAFYSSHSIFRVERNSHNYLAHNSVSSKLFSFKCSEPHSAFFRLSNTDVDIILFCQLGKGTVVSLFSNIITQSTGGST